MRKVYQLKNDGVLVYSFPFVMPKEDANMYLIILNDEALVIDPNESEKAFDLLKSYSVKKVIILLSHEHYDHISGVNKFRSHFDCNVICSEKCSLALSSTTKNLSKFFMTYFWDDDGKTKRDEIKFNPNYSCFADEVFVSEKRLNFHGHDIYLRETLGHSQGSICILIDDEILFCGDSLMLGKKVVTNCPGGSRKTFESNVLPYFYSLKKDLLVLPGHGECASLSKMLETV